MDFEVYSGQFRKVRTKFLGIIPLWPFGRVYWVREATFEMEVRDKEGVMLSYLRFNDGEDEIFIQKAQMIVENPEAYNIMIKQLLNKNKKRRISGEMYQTEDYFSKRRELWKDNGFNIDLVGNVGGYKKFIFKNY